MIAPVAAMDPVQRALLALQALQGQPLANPPGPPTAPADAAAPKRTAPSETAGLPPAANMPSQTLRTLAAEPGHAAAAPAAALKDDATGRPPMAQTARPTGSAPAAPAAATDAAANTAPPAHLHAEPVSGARPAEALAAPVLVTPLFTLPADAARPRDVAPDEAVPRRGRRVERDDDPPADDATADLPRADDDEAPEPTDHAPAAAVAADATDAAAAALARWRTRLADAGQHEALRELGLRRRVMVVRPAQADGAPAEAVLLGAHPRPLVQRFRARWWSAAPADAWPAWRLYRDDRGLAHGLHTRGAGATCRLRFATAAPALGEPADALLDLHDLQRFERSLGRQWSLLLIAEAKAI